MPDKKVSRSKEEKATLKGMRAMLKVFEQHPDLPLPYNFGNISLFCGTADHMMATAKHIPGKLDKQVTEHYFSLSRKFGGKAQLDLTVNRGQVCTKRVVRVEEVPAETITRDAYKREIVEWDCPPALAVLVNKD